MKFKSSTLLVAFNDDNQIYSQGMLSLLEDIFTHGMGISLSRMTGSPGNSSIRVADIYVDHCAAGVQAMCRPEYRLRKQCSLLIVISSARGEISQNTILPCQHNCVFLHRTDTLAEIRRQIILAWHRRFQTKEVSCHACRPLLLTKSEERVIDYLSQGTSLSELVDRLALSPKTVSSQKHSLMRKFSLSNNVELMDFILWWKRYEPTRRLKATVSPATAIASTLPKMGMNNRQCITPFFTAKSDRDEKPRIRLKVTE